MLRSRCWLFVAVLAMAGVALVHDAPAPDAPPPDVPARHASAQDASAQDASAAEAAAAERVAQLERRVVELLAEGARLRDERDRLVRLLERIGANAERYEADRILLTELRKELPESRGEAELYLERLRRLALIADPVRLAPVASRMIDASTVFLDWRHRSYPDPDARSRAFAQTGAHGFPTALTSFRNAVLLSTANRIEGLLILIE